MVEEDLVDTPGLKPSVGQRKTVQRWQRRATWQGLAEERELGCSRREVGKGSESGPGGRVPRGP